jgi:hypothetical protein
MVAASHQPDIGEDNAAVSCLLYSALGKADKVSIDAHRATDHEGQCEDLNISLRPAP